MRIAALLVAIVVAPACTRDSVEECGGGAGGSCEEACRNLFEIDCHVGESKEECVGICTAATAALDEDVRGRVLSCTQGADTCEAADGCGRACGEGGGEVPFEALDGGPNDEDDAGIDGGT